MKFVVRILYNVHIHHTQIEFSSHYVLRAPHDMPAYLFRVLFCVLNCICKVSNEEK